VPGTDRTPNRSVDNGAGKRTARPPGFGMSRNGAAHTEESTPMAKWLVLPMLVLAYTATSATGAAPRDRDHDRLPDRWERKYHLSTAIPSAKRDPDNDHLTNRRERRLRTHPRRADTDRDGLRDGAEVRRFHTNPRKRDTDGDTFWDRCERRSGTNPRKRRSLPAHRCSESPQSPPRHMAPGPLHDSPKPIEASPDPTRGLPNARNTGVPPGTTLTPSGSMTISAAGTVVDGRDIKGCVTVNAPNVTIRKSRVRCDGSSAIRSGSTGLTIEDTTVECGNKAGQTAITPANYAARRVDASRCENTMWADNDVLIEDSFIHDEIPYDPARDPHTDGIQVPAGGKNITIRHNTVYGGYESQSNFGNSAITTGASPGAGNTNLTITDNLLAGGGFTVYCPDVSSSFTFTNNRFSRVLVDTVGGFGPMYSTCDDDYDPSNVYHETGEPVSMG
jgi:hypothetical protein